MTEWRAAGQGRGFGSEVRELGKPKKWEELTRRSAGNEAFDVRRGGYRA